MPIQSADDLLRSLEQLTLLSSDHLRELADSRPASDARTLAGELLRRGWLSAFQINQLFRGQGAMLRLGPYVLLDRLGEGGMGAVYKALQTQLDRIVALKVIRRERINNPGVINRFQREIRAAAQLQHPNVVTVHDAGEDGDTLFLVMEYVEGTDLAKLLKQRGPLPIAEACDCARQAALGLEHIRQRGLVHRDIKPANLLRAAEHGLIKIADLGLARLRGDEGALTADGSVLGTPDFLAPEQALDARSVDIRADLYSLGGTLYCLLSGQPPYPGGSAMEKLMRHQRETPVPLRSLRADVPAAVEALVSRLMARNPADRFQTPGEAATALAEVLAVPAVALAAVPVALPVSAVSGNAPTAALASVPSGGQETLSSMVTTDWNAKKSSSGDATVPDVPPRWGLRPRRKVLFAAGAGLALLLVLIMFWPRSNTNPGKDNDDDNGANVLPDPTDPFPTGPAADRGTWIGLADSTPRVRGATRWQLLRRHSMLQTPPSPGARPDGRRFAMACKD